MRAVIEAACRQRVAGNVAFVLLAFTGVVAFLQLPVDAWPDVSLDEAWITTYWDGAGAEQVERLITDEIEEEIEGLRGVKRIISISGPGSSFIDVKFDESLSRSDFESAFNDLRTALDRVTDLPEDAERPVLQKLTTSEIYPLFQVAVTAFGEDVPEIVLREVARDLKRELETVEGVTKVTYSGYHDRELQVLVSRERSRKFGVDLAEVLGAIERTGRNQPAGTIQRRGPSGAIEDEVRLEQDSEFENEWDVLDAVVRAHPDGPPLRVRDLARVAYGFEERKMISRFNGRPAVMLNVAKDDDSNSLRLREACQEVLDRVQERVPEGVGFGVTADSTEVVRSRFTVLVENLLLGLIFVAVILWGLLGIRNALIAVVGIPFSFLCAFLFFPLFDLSVNNLTLFGLVLVGGMLVDDAVVVLENIYRRVELGEPLRRAVVDGTYEVAWPVINAVATTSAAMLPLLIQGGVTGKFFAFIPKAVLLALAASLIQCFTILPIHYLDWGARRRRGASGAAREPRGARLRRAFFERLYAVYTRLLGVFLRHRLAVLSILVGGSIALVGFVARIPQDPWTSDFNAIFVAVDTDSSYSLEQTDRAMKHLERTLDEFVERDVLESYSTTVGFKITTDGVFIRRPNVALVLGELVDRVEITSNPEAPLNAIRAALEKAIAAQGDHDIEALTVFPPHDGPPLGRPVAVRVESNDYAQAREVSELIQAELRGIDGVFGVQDNLELGPVEYTLQPREELAARRGLYPLQLGVALRAANDGLVAASFHDGDEDVDVRVMYASAVRSDPQSLLETDVRTSSGELVPLDDVVDVEVARENAVFYHYDTRRTVLVTAEVNASVITGPEVNRRLQRTLADIPQRYPAVRLHFGGEFEETQKSMANQRRSFWIAIVLIYLILAAQFRNYFQPMVVLATVPFGVLGVLIGLWIRDQPFTIPTFIAIVGLAGVVVNESLVMVVFINRRLRELPIHEAIVEGARQRLRPILITSATTIGNLVPLAFGFGGTSKVWTPFAVSIVFGMSFATLVTLFITPLIYSMTARRKLRELEGDGEEEAP